MNRTISTAGLVVAALVIGCGSSVPPSQVASAETAVRSARASGADQNQEAKKHLRMAEDELAKAKKLNADKDHDEAMAMFNRASADAALAESLANESKKKALIAAPPPEGPGMMQEQMQPITPMQPMQPEQPVQPGR